MKARITIMPKTGVRDPEGRAIAHGLQRLGFKEAGEARKGKHIELDIAAASAKQAKAKAEAMCRDFLANPVIEDWRIEID